jgi:hypothetical protein
MVESAQRDREQRLTIGRLLQLAFVVGFFLRRLSPGRSARTRRGKSEQYGQVNFLDAGLDRISNTDVYGDGNSSACQCGCRPKP